MNIKSNKKIVSWILCMMLIVAMAFITIGCSTNDKKDDNQSSAETQKSVETQRKVLGEGKTKFLFTVVDQDGNEEEFEIYTDKTIVGDALLEVDLISGEQGDYGLYVKTVNGITVDYGTDKAYWAFYAKGEYAAAGVDETTIEDGAAYSFRVEK